MARRKGLKLLGVADVERVPVDRRSDMLSGYQARLLELSRDDETRRRIFEAREQLAAVFDLGGESAADMASFLRRIESDDDIRWNVPARRIPDSAEFQSRPPGFYVFGSEKLSREQVVDIRRSDRTPFKVGNPIYVRLDQLFRTDIVSDDDRPIYVTDAPTPNLIRAFAVLLLNRPELKERIFWLNWNSGEMSANALIAGSAVPLNAAHSEETALALRGVEVQMDGIPADEARLLFQALNHVPRSGEVYNGHVTKVSEFGVWITILPGREGILHSSKLPHGTSGDWHDAVVVGDTLRVVVTEVEPGFGSNHWITLDVDDSDEDLAYGGEAEPAGAFLLSDRGPVIDVPFQES